MEKNNRNEEKVRTNGHSHNEDYILNIGSSDTRSDTSIAATGDGNKQILVPLDGSPLAEMALPHAIALARATSSGLVLMRVVPLFNLPISRVGPMGYMGSMGPMYYESENVEKLYNEQLELARDYLEEVVERLASVMLRVETSVIAGTPEEVIVRYAQDHPHVVAIAMSTHGRSGVGRWLFGSVAEKVSQSASVPVLLVRPGAETEGKDISDPASIPLYRTLLAPLDGSLFAEQALDQAQPLARALDARIVLLSVVSTPFDLKLVKRDATADWSAMPWYTPAAQTTKYLDGITQKLAAGGLDAQAEVTYGDVADEILKAARFLEADIIVLTTHGHGDPHRPWPGSVATRVAQEANLPVLLVRAQVVERSEEAADELAAGISEEELVVHRSAGRT